MNTLEIRNLSKTYTNGVKALDSISLSVGNGMFGLLGPNGAGKSTLMRTIATLQEPDQGQVFFQKIDIHKNPQSLRRQLGYLPQDFGVYPKISAYQLLDHFAVLKGVINKKDRQEQVSALLQQTNLYEKRKKAVGTFSGGMRQRFGIAQALLGNPKLIIVDEPTAGLDPEERNRFHNLLSEIGENVVVVLSTHIVEDVSDLCPEMAILSGGRIVLKGQPNKLMDSLRGRIWYKKVPKDVLSDYREAFQVISTRLFAGQTLIHIVADTKPEPGFEPLQPGLEDVYFSVLTGAWSGEEVPAVC
ncbi:ABC transporter ATP-binding protein [Fulvivirga imtechensis AK7]|uniref:ABC transporter ATP-binding protein n=1 Tax=Fulvivirga imtechensis AK7 TaxID=1237149 RepID=L8JRK2_9BACT|nr:ABC transporter ATP-binding protein [Fulvivirga imtechensis]ELR70803.1 ABC transporter ATP-binding protein [Fulvivirga imtechensis AK7]